MPIGEWFDDMIWCPSQCYCRVQRGGKDYILYLRWRWDDPWQAHIVKNAASLADMHIENAEWSEDLFEKGGIYFKDDEVEQAKTKLLELFEGYK